MITRLRLIAPAIALCLPAAALAHPGHGAEQGGFWLGLLHPLSGWDHLTAMLLAGAWAAMLGGRMRWMLPGVFTTSMLAGFALAKPGLSGLAEGGIMLSVIVLGAVSMLRWRAPLALGVLGMGLFGLAHGVAHGLEMPADMSGLRFAAGFLLGSLSLQAAGLWLGRYVPSRAIAAS